MCNSCLCTRRRAEGKERCLKGASADGPGVEDMFSQLNVLLPVRQEVCDPLQVESGTLCRESLSCSRAGMTVLKAEVHKQDPGIGS